MRRRDVDKLKVGDYLELKHNLGKGIIVKITMDKEDEPAGASTIGRYPMIKFTDSATKAVKDCTYLMIDWWQDPSLPRH